MTRVLRRWARYVVVAALLVGSATTLATAFNAWTARQTPEAVVAAGDRENPEPAPVDAATPRPGRGTTRPPEPLVAADSQPDIATPPAGADTDAGATSRDTWTVISVVDGDTIDVLSPKGSQERVRVIGIDTPERGSCGFSEASEALSALLLDRDVVLRRGAIDDRDHYGRLLRYVDVEGVDAGLLLIKGGLAIARYDSRDGYGRHPREDVYVAADLAVSVLCGSDAGPVPAAAPVTDSGAGRGESWGSCTEARAAGGAPVYRGDPGYGRHLDGDGDGVGCE